MKICSRCRESKPLAAFGRHAKAKDGRNWMCRRCNAEHVQAWRRANPERRKAQETRERERHREQRRAAGLARYHRLMAEDPDRVRKQRREWVRTPKGVIANRAARHARRGAPLSAEAKAWWIGLVDPVCHYCDAAATEIDHVLPISKGGTGDLSNLVPACRSCNARKNDNLIGVR